MIILVDGLVLLAVLDDTPAEHGHGERHREMELGVVSGVVVAPNQPSLRVRAIPV